MHRGLGRKKERTLLQIQQDKDCKCFQRKCDEIEITSFHGSHHLS